MGTRESDSLHECVFSRYLGFAYNYAVGLVVGLAVIAVYIRNVAVLWRLTLFLLTIGPTYTRAPTESVQRDQYG